MTKPIKIQVRQRYGVSGQRWHALIISLLMAVSGTAEADEVLHFDIGSVCYFGRLQYQIGGCAVGAHQYIALAALSGVQFKRHIADVLSSLDGFVSPSRGEGFSNVIGEAMACGIPCIVTNAGDFEDIVGNTGWVVPVGDAEALAGAMHQFFRRWGADFDGLRRRDGSRLGG